MFVYCTQETCYAQFRLCWHTSQLGGNSPGPLFQFKNGVPLTREAFVRAVRSALRQVGLDETKYAGHSFHIGAATTAAACGTQDSLIKALGRWESSAYSIYIKLPRTQLAAVSSHLVAVPDWDHSYLQPIAIFMHMSNYFSSSMVQCMRYSKYPGFICLLVWLSVCLFKWASDRLLLSACYWSTLSICGPNTEVHVHITYWYIYRIGFFNSRLY